MAREFWHRQRADIDLQVAASERRPAPDERPADRSGDKDGNQDPLFDARGLRDLPGASARAELAPSSFSVTGLVSYRRCPRQYYWMAVRPLPRQASEAARTGTAIHRWIEQRGHPQLGLLEPGFNDPQSNVLGPIHPDRGGEVAGGALSGLRAAFLASPYAALDPVRIEAPFVLVVSGRAVRGRIDAVYRRAGKLELVDFKTGSPPDDGDPAATTQLDLYAVAVSEVWGEQPSSLRTTYCYLCEGGTFRLLETDWDDARMASARARLSALLAGLAAGEYGAAPGAWCARCEWRGVCRPGRSFLSSLPAGPDQSG